jgi:putative ATPase
MTDSMFENKYEPLAFKLRPTDFSKLIGQEKTVTKLQSLQKPISLILYGPPGSGKTSVSFLLCKKWNLPYRQLNAVSSGVKDIKDLSSEAKRIGSLVLFIDEIHRFSTSQQDSLLESVEKGEFILIGATTENPAFRINRPLLSRCQIYKLDSLSEKELLEILENGIQYLQMILSIDAKNLLIRSSGGDARRLLTLLESLSSFNQKIEWDGIETEKFLSSQVFQYDKNKENHYDFVSAFIKSVRGSDPDAALYYLACMLEGGEDPIFIMRRLIILSSEDIGNASVNALTMSVAALTALEKIGMPEGRIILSQITCFLAASPKSNASYRAIDSAIEFVQKNKSLVEIPMHLRNAPTFLHKQEGASKDYKYPHNNPNHFIVENYFPENLKENPPQFYFPSNEGFDKTLKDRLKILWEKSEKKNYKDTI